MKSNSYRFQAILSVTAMWLLGVGWADAGSILKLDNTNALTDPLSWSGGVAPGSGDIAQWNGTYASTNAWYLVASTNWSGIQLISPSQSLTIRNDGSLLTLGAGGIDLSAAGSAGLTFNNPVVLSAAQTWSVTNGRTLTISGAVTNNFLLSITNNGSVANGGTVQVGNSATSGSLSGNVALVGGVTLAIARSDSAMPIGGSINGNSTNCLVKNNSTAATNTTTLNFADGVNTFGGIQNASAGTLVLAATANNTNIFRLPNGLSSSGPLHNANLAGTLVIQGGTWVVTNSIGVNTAGAGTWCGTNYLTNATVIAGDARYIHGITYIQNGGAFLVTNLSGTRLDFGGDLTTATDGIYVQNGGSLNVYASGYGFQVNAAGNGFVQQNGGLVQVGVNGASSGNKNLLLGSSTTTSVNQYNLAGGKLVVAGSIMTNSPDSSVNYFNWTGGTLVASTVNVGLAGAYGISGGVLTNAGGTLAPGDIGTAGKTIITGNFVQTAGSFAVDLGGKTNATTFTTNASGFYDNVSVSGTAALGGTLNVSLINSFVPAATNAFTIVTAAGGFTVGPTNFANNYGGYIPVSFSPLKYIQAVVMGNNLVLTNYGVTPPALAASFTPTNATGVAPFAVNWMDTSTGVITNRHWDFGDGTTLDGNSTAVTHTYASIGNYTNVLTIADVLGNTSSATGIVHAVAASVSLTWKGDGVANAWNTTTANWLNGAAAALYADPDDVTFDDSGSASPAVAVNFSAQPASVTFNNNTKNYSFTGTGGINGNASVTLNNAGTVTFLNTNTYTGPTVINAGTLQVGNGTTSGAIDASSAITDNGALVLNQPDNHNIAVAVSGIGSFTKSGAGTLTLGVDNSATFSGSIAVNGGTLAAATDNSLGSSSVPVTLNNGTLQFNTSSPFTLSRSLTFNGTNDGLNVNGNVILPATPTGSAAVSIGGSGTLQIDQGGTSVTLPTNIFLNGGSITYQRTDNYAQPGVVGGNSISSSINNAGTSAGSTNTLTFAGGYNLFGNLLNTASGDLDLNGFANSTNVVGGAGGLSYTGNSSLTINGGTFVITNANVVGSTAGSSTGTLTISGGTLYSSYVNGNIGGSRHFKGNLVINGGAFHITTDRLSMDDSSGSQTLSLSAGNLLFDNIGGGGNYGFRFGNDNGSPGQAGYNFSGVQVGGLLACSNSPITIGGITAGKSSSYLLTGGTVVSAGLTLCSDTNGTGVTSFTITNTAKLNVFGTINGGTLANTAVQVFSFVGGALAASAVDSTYLRDSTADPVGTFVNGGGVLLPGDAGYPGRLTITGNFSNAPAAALDIEIGGTTAASVGQETINTNRYDNVLVVATNGMVVLNGNLNVSLLNGFEPQAPLNNQFTILSITNGTNSLGTPSLSGSFANLTGGRVHLVGDANRSFAVTITSTNVVLGNYQTPTPQAYFAADRNLGTNTLTVTFTNLSNGSGLTNLWVFGDGSTSTSSATIIQHTYSALGTNTVSLIVGNILGSNVFTRSNSVAVVASSTPLAASIATAAIGNSVVLTWPNGLGWILEAQTNTLATGLGTNWIRLPSAVSPFTNTADPANGAVFYRLTFP